MEIIKNNPYRIIGILVGTSTKEEHSKTKKLKMYIEAEQEVPEDYSFPILGSFNRNLKTIDDAVSKLNLNSDRVNASIFWFYNGNAITDEPMFEAMKLSKDKAKEAVYVWEKLISSEVVTSRNASAFQNLSTFYLNSAFKKNTIYKNKLEKGITLKLKFLQSDFFIDYIKLSSDQTYKISVDSVQIYFLNQVYNEIEKLDTNLMDWFISIISKIDFNAKENYLKDFISKPIDQIKSRIEETKIKRKATPKNGIELGLSLFQNEVEKIKTIKNIVGANNIHFASISDKLSEEILQCGVDYFKKFKDSKFDPSSHAMDLFKKAKKIAVGSVVIQRCQDNIENLQEWINEKPERDKHNRISADLKALIEIFERFENKSETIENARLLINFCEPHIKNIKYNLGASDEIYLKLSTRVVSQAQSYIITEVNKAQENFEYKITIDKYGTINKLKTTLKNAWEVTILINAFDMERVFKTNQFNPNKDALKNLCNQLGVGNTGSSFSTSSPTSRPNNTNSPPRPPDDSFPGWVKILGIIILMVILSKACN